MTKTAVWRTLGELGATAVAALLLIALMVWTRATWVLALLLPIEALGRVITDWLQTVFPEPDQPFRGMGRALAIDAFLTWIAIWFLMMVAVKLIKRFRNRTREQA
jgi:hypothetical protein